MHIDPRLNEIDDCLYRVAARALVIQDNKVLLVKETLEKWWAFPGGGVDHGETVELSLTREIEEELGIPAKEVVSGFQIAHYDISNIVNGVPRMNIFYKISIPAGLLQKTTHVAEWKWFTKGEFMKLDMGPSYKNRTELANVIFGK